MSFFVGSSELNVTQIRSRYSRLHIPSDFYHTSYTWHRSIPLDHPLKFITPCSFHIFNKNVPRLGNEIVSILDPPDADYTWNVRVSLNALILLKKDRMFLNLGDVNVITGYPIIDNSFMFN
jgi:hypothetical protein